MSSIANRTLKNAIRSLFWLIVVITSGILFFGVWVTQSTRSLSWIEGFIERELNGYSPYHSVDIVGLSVEWQGLIKGFELQFKQMDLLTDNQTELVVLNDLSAKLDFSYLLLNRNIFFDEITLSSINIDTLVSKTSAQSASDAHGNATRFLEAIFQRYEKGRLLPFKQIVINNITGQLDEGSPQTNLFNSITARITQTGKYILADLNANQREKGEVAARLSINSSGDAHLEGSLESVIMESFYFVYPNITNLPSLRDMRLSGRFEVGLDAFTTLRHILVELRDAAETNADFMTLSYRATAKSDGDIQRTIAGDLALSVLNYDELLTLWPHKALTKARRWVEQHIETARLSDLKAAFDITRDGSMPSRLLPDDAVKITYNISDAVLTPLRNRPTIEHATGSMAFTGNAMEANIRSARIANSRLDNAEILISPFGRLARLEMKGELDGKLHELLPFAIKNYENIPLVDLGDARGDVSGILRLGINISPKQPREFAFNSDITVKNFIATTRLPNNKRLKGKVLVRGEKDKVMIAPQLIKGDKEASFNLSIPVLTKDRSFTLSTQQVDQVLTLLGWPRFATGETTLDIVRTEKNHYKITGDGAQLSFNSDFLAWKKPAGMSFSYGLMVDATQPSSLRIYNMSIDSEVVSAVVPNLEFKDGRLERLSLGRFKTPSSNFSALIEKEGLSQTASIAGSKLHAGLVLLLKEFFVQMQDAQKVSGGVQMDLQITQFTLHETKELFDFKMHMTCKNRQCDYVKVTAMDVEQRPFRLYYDVSKHGKIELISSDIGALLQHLNISQILTRGKVELSLNEKADGVFRGGVIMKDFVVQDLPILTRILNLASLTGFLELLSSGVAFNSMKSNLSYQNRIMTLHNLEASGSSMGITAQGTVDSGERKLDISGVVVPSYMINSLLGRIPFLGKLLIGRKGEGVIATRYEANGDIDDPNISVNPLSMLTPGFLRNIWGSSSDGNQKVTAPSRASDMELQ